MKLVTVYIIIILLACAYPTAMSRKLSTKSSSSVNKAFQQWIHEYGRTYSNTTEMNKRRVIFKEELKYVKKFNKAGDEGYTIGLNQYSDWTDEEYFGSQLPKYLPTIETEEIQNIPFVKYVRAVSFVG
ncbi:putative fruit bromelain [Medicago truncatula]|uniref:Cathepsin propeptide inhibitor domain protein n=1 Tax=Medicago truncatula TaxID=3880 RepID=G7I3S5_MEDTR|nr:cathepsin propeptide inhibitor domain protein [Medicago truncatula]AES60230.1 cathepsin propeptide inhibitor domain protein [Medicago truncatula]RHN78561.1 putative fruit bromelain [Medicago truncatula]